MDEKELPSSSDESDADFVPKEEDENSDSRSEVSDCETSEDESNNKKTRKRKKRSKKDGKKAKTEKSEDEEDKEVVEEKQKTDIDALWADFKKDVNNFETKKTAQSYKPETENLNSKSSEGQVQKNPLDNKQNKGGFSFPSKSRGGGLSNVLSRIGKKDKMSTLQKSQLDWKKFKQSEGIEEEIKMYNRGKDGYLEKQDFLQRTDLRQFEIEKDLRISRRKF